MPLYDSRCLSCWDEREQWARSGEHPACLHCGGPTEYVWRGKAASVIGDEIDEVHSDLDPDGSVVRFRSRTERRQYLEAYQLRDFVRHVPLPGSDRSPHTVDWSRGSIDPYTIAAAEALIARVSDQGSKGTEAEIRCETAQFAVREMKVWDVD